MSYSTIDVFLFRIRGYNAIWSDLRTFSQGWRRVWIPSQCVFDLGSSEAVYTAISRHLIYEKPSPIIFMRAQKNAIEREGMQRAHVLDGAAMCEALSLLESRVNSCHQLIYDMTYIKPTIFTVLQR